MCVCVCALSVLGYISDLKATTPSQRQKHGMGGLFRRSWYPFCVAVNGNNRGNHHFGAPPWNWRVRRPVLFLGKQRNRTPNWAKATGLGMISIAQLELGSFEFSEVGISLAKRGASKAVEKGRMAERLPVEVCLPLFSGLDPSAKIGPPWRLKDDGGCGWNSTRTWWEPSCGGSQTRLSICRRPLVGIQLGSSVS